MKENKMYVIVRNDLSVAYRCVQGAHVLAEYAIVFSRKFKKWGNYTLIFLAVPNLIALKEIDSLLNNNTIDYVCFHEPDLDDHITAIAFHSCDMNQAVSEVVATLNLTY